MEIFAKFDVNSLRDLDLAKLRDSSICILGGTGFIGTLLISSLKAIEKLHGLGIRITVYTRDLDKASKKFLTGATDYITIKEFDFLLGTCNLGVFDYIVIGATPTSSKPGPSNKGIFLQPTLNAVESVIFTAETVQNYPRVLNLSSGAVYGPQSLEVINQPEKKAELFDYSDEYCRAKYLSEKALSEFRSQEHLAAISPRLFSFYGPGLPLDKHFAIGNFIRDGLSGRAIRVLGSPGTRRSYMGPGDLTTWLLRALIDPKPGFFNIGSENSISMVELATLISQLTSNKGVEVPNPETLPSNYVPSTLNFRSAYNLSESVLLADGLRSWINTIISSSDFQSSSFKS